MPCVKRLCHGAKILAQTRCFGRSDSIGDQNFLKRKRSHLRARCGGTERAKGASGMKSVFIMTWRTGFGELGFHFDTEVVREQEILARNLLDFGNGKTRRQHRSGGMGK